jgi:GABA(A) receptor-associated protein
MPKYTEKHNPFTIEHPSTEERKSESDNIKLRFPSKRPVIIYSNDKNLDTPQKYKFLVPEDQTIALFQTVIRKNVNLTSEQALWIYVKDGTLPPATATIASAYDDYANEDGFLYICYMGENVFGGC